MSIAVFASFSVCNNERFIRGGKVRRTSFLHPSCPYKSFSRTLNLGVNTSQCSEKTIGYSKRAHMQLQANTEGPGAVQLPAPAAIFWSPHGGSDRTFSPNVPQEVKTRGSCLVFLPRLGERTRVRSEAAGSEGLTLLERLQWHCCPLPTPKITYVDRDALHMEPS